MNAMPFDSLLFGGCERGNVRVRSARERRIPVSARMHCGEDARGATNVVRMRVRQHERVDRSATPEEVRKNGRATSIAATPCGTRIEQKPLSAIRAKQNRVALSDVENMELHAIAVGH